MGAADDARDAAVDEMEVDGGERHRDKERRERHRREEKDHHGSGRRDRGREKDKDDRRREKDDSKRRDRDRERDREKDSKHRDRDKEPERDRGCDRDRGKDREREPERPRDKDRGKDREREPERERDKERERRDRDKERSRNRDKVERGEREDREREKSKGKGRGEDDADLSKGDEGDQKQRVDASGEAEQPATAELRERIARAKEERLKDKKEGGILDGNNEASEILSWVGKSRKLDEKRRAENEKALRLARAFEEQDNILAENGDDDDEEEEDKQVGDHLSGVKVLHGLDKVLEGGAVVMTLKDQSILADGDVNEEADMLENIEIGEQKQRDEAYKAAKKKGTYEDKFNEDSLSKKPILSHYDDPMDDEGVTLDEGGRFTGEAEKKLEELRKRIEGGYVQKKTEDLTSTTKMSTDYFTPDEMLQFKKPKKKKSIRKKEKLDLDALEAEAIAAGLGAADLGSRNDAKRQSAREEEQKADAEKRSSAYQAAIAKAEEASKALRQDKTTPGKSAEEELVFGDDYEDLQRSLEQARKLALRKQEEAATSGPMSVAELATAAKGGEDADATEGDVQQNKVVITEMEEFVWGLQLNEDSRKPEADDVFMDEDGDVMPSNNRAKDDTNGSAAMEDEAHTEKSVKVEEEEVKPDEVIHEVAVGKGLAGALKILKERGTLNEGTDWGGRTTDKKKSKLVGIEDGPKEIRIERMDEFGRVMTPKEAFRDLSHKFHGKGPGKMKLEKRQKKFQDEMKTKRMKSSDTPLMAAEKMREAQALNQTPYLILSGNAKTSQASDASGFATVEKEHPGSLTPMLGDKKVEHFLGIKRSAQPGSLPPPVPKKPKN
ncbi:SART-1 family protein DOT2-like [Phragmites australis]|uniref:SART-1 family protein DOT2-like n=1 Tax=Phragmites australis TaxID=29695 RepID=UPI002D796C11|nr:SART-1 family protein DOT2-like [Phragmites australis]XP_062226750.1 SART-1 family protein DOT2-like [Phragmites australis]